MAEDIEIGIGADASPAVRQIETMVRGLENAVRAADRLEVTYRNIAAQAARADKDATARLKAMRDKAKLETEALSLQKAKLLERESVRGNNKKVSDDALIDYAVTSFIRGFNVSNKQVQARIREAANTAAERLITASADALAAKLNQTRVSTFARKLNFGSAEAMQAQEIKARNSNYQLMQQYGGFTTLGEFLEAKDRKKREDEDQRIRDRIRRNSIAAEARQMEADANRLARKAERDRQRSDFGLRTDTSSELLRERAGRFVDYAGLGTGVFAITSLTQGIVDLDDAMVRFRAITQTSNAEMIGFKKTLLELGQTSRYSLKDLTEAAITLGQTGLNAPGVLKALEPITQLATASGAPIGQAVEVVTAAMGAYNMEASRAGEVANTMTAALNQTKLTMQQLGLGMQYAANVARESDVSFTELTAVLGGLAQAGIRSGSTLGTGVRQLIQELSSPSDKLKNVLQALNISLGDIDIRSNTLTGVLENLRSKGFGTAEALRSLDLRAASAFSALAGQTDTVKRLQETLLLTNAAYEGARDANESFSASISRLGNTLLGLADRSFAPLLSALKATSSLANSALSALGGNETANQLGGIAASWALIGAAVPKMAEGTAMLVKAASGARAATPMITGLVSGLAALAASPFLTASAIVGVGLTAWLVTSGSESNKLAERLDQVKKRLNELTADQLQTQQGMSTLGTMLDSLITRREKLNDDPIMRRTVIIEAQKAFEQWGLTVDVSATKVDDLIAALQRLRGVMQENMTRNLSEQLVDLQAKFALLVKEIKLSQADITSNVFWKSGGSFYNRGDQRSFLDQQFSRFGLKRGNEILNFMLSNPENMNTEDIRGTSNDYMGYLGSERDRVQARIRGYERKGSLSQLDMTDLNNLRQFEQIIVALVKELTDYTGRATNLQANIRAQDENRIGAAASSLQGTATYQNLATRRDALFQEFTSKAQVIAGNNEIGPAEKFNRYRELQDQIRGQVDKITQELDAFAQGLLADGTGEEVVRRAVGALRAEFVALSEGVAGQLDVMKKAIASGKISNRTEKSRLERELQTLNRQLANATDKAVFDAVSARILEVMAAIAKNEEFGLNLDQGMPRKRTPEQEAQLEEIRTKAIWNEADFREKQAEMEKRRLDQSLAAEDQMLASQRAEIDRQIANLMKELNDPRTTEEKAKKLKTAIEALIEKGIQVLERQGEIDVRRSVMKTPDGYNVVPGVVKKDTVAGQIVDVLRALGKEDLAGTALGFASTESGFDPNARNGRAMGLFQYMPRTWAAYGRGGDINKVEDQVRAFVDYIDVLTKVFSKTTNRIASPRELYVMWQQGEAGGKRLFGADPTANVLDTLAAAYPGPRGRQIAAKAITGNGGTTDMTVQDFLNLIMATFDKGVRKAGGIVKTNRDVAEEDARSRTAAGKERYTQEGKDAAKGVSDKVWENLKRKASEDDKVDMRDIETKRKLLTRTYDAPEADKTLKEILDLYKKMAERAIENLKKSPEFEGLSPEQQKGRIDDIRARYREMAERDALSGAGQSGKNMGAQARQELNLLKQQKALMDEGRVDFSGEEYRKVEKALDAQQKKVDLIERELEKSRELQTLNQTIEQIKQSGLGTEQELTDLTARKAALEKEVVEAKKLSSIYADAEARRAAGGTLGNALSAGSDKFFKGVGLMDSSTGRWKTMTEQMSDMWNQALGSMDSALSQLFVNLASGTMKGKDAFKQFATSVIQDMMKIASQALSRNILKALFGGDGSLGGGTGGGEGGGLFSAIGGIFKGIFGGGAYNGGSMRFSMGGMIPHYAGGGAASNRDSRLILAQPGEYMMRKTAVDAIGTDTLDQLNGLGPNKVSKPGPAKRGKDGKPSSVNVWVVSPEQVPPPGPRDIIATIAQDIQNRGTIRQLVKQVSVGQA